MRWQKAARLVVAAVGIGTAAAAYFLMRERPAPNKPPVAAPADPTAKMQSGAGKQVRYEGNRLLGTLTFSDFRTYDDGRSVWQTFHYKLEDGTVLSADRVEAKGTADTTDTPDELVLTGNVSLRTADETTLGGDTGTYSESTGRASVPGKTTFSRARMSGTGTGGAYERETGVFKLLADAKVAIAAEDPATVPLEATAATMTYTSAAKAMVFDENARLVRAAETMTADHATLYLSDDEEQFELIELRGRSKVTPSDGAASDLPEMEADDIDLGFYEGGQALQRAGLVGRATMIQRGERGRQSIEAPKIDFTTAPDGKTLTRLETTRRAAKDRVIVRTPGGSGVPARTITALTLVASGDDRNGLSAALFDGGVEFVETGSGRAGGPPSRRVGTSQRLTLVLKGQLDAIEQAQFERDVTFTSGDVRGDADVGVYRAAAGEMDLQPSTQTRGRRARVVDEAGGVIVEAAELITVFLNTNNLYARRDVSTVTSSSKAQRTASSTSLFNTADPIYGFGTEFRYDDAAETATYLGTPEAVAQLKQGNNIVNGQEILYFRIGQDLQAKGRVDTTFDMTTSPRGGRAGGGPVTPVSYRVTADTLMYTEKTRTAKYAGNVTIRSADGATTAGFVDMMLAPDSRTLDQLAAEERVHAVLTGGREARGDRLVYDARQDLYELWGKPVTLVTREADGTCYAQDGIFVRFEGKLGAPDFPADRNADGGAPRRVIDCPAPPKK